MTDPIEVGWIVDGRIGLTFAPGKQGPSFFGPPWKRDLRADLDRLASFGVRTLVSLMEEHELKTFAIPDLREVARERSIVVERFPVPDGGVPADLGKLRQLVDLVLLREAAGHVVILHCRGGLGRSGTLGGCVLVALGHTPDQALAILDRARGPHCPENDVQRDLIRRFAAEIAARPAFVPAPLSLGDVASLDRRAAKFAGAVIGGAVGDAMGHPTEFIRSLDEIRARFGPNGVEGYELFWEREGRRFAPYTDDTQMAELVLRSLAHGISAENDLEATMSLMARSFVGWAIAPQGGHRAPGRACLSGSFALEQGVPWHSAGEENAGGCGSVMRAYPFGLLFDSDLEEAERWAVEHSQLTHGDPIARAACAAIAVGVALAVRDERPLRIAEEMIAAAARHSQRTGEMMARALKEAHDGTPPEVTLGRLEGWAAHEAIAAALYVFARHPDDLRTGILEGANTIGDSDSIATLVGALVGARLGIGAIPPEWQRDIERGEALLSLAVAASTIRLTSDDARVPMSGDGR